MYIIGPGSMCHMGLAYNMQVYILDTKEQIKNTGCLKKKTKCLDIGPKVGRGSSLNPNFFLIFQLGQILYEGGGQMVLITKKFNIFLLTMLKSYRF